MGEGCGRSAGRVGCLRSGGAPAREAEGLIVSSRAVKRVFERDPRNARPASLFHSKGVVEALIAQTPPDAARHATRTTFGIQKELGCIASGAAIESIAKAGY